eukprot:TRINITY_DN6607_c0_g1_i1.p1 TRINITY_DN6607_c0_g1~~TRINITY_DN6607_c0_g1_i1.p1  ORF type:complete len:1476 (-),score=228.81 TRINITY_DN6607_c0_g1_i1:131-4558(-)
MQNSSPPSWGSRPPEVPLVRNKADLHNISQDSGLSHSPIQQFEAPQLTIGNPIKHIDNLRPPIQKENKKEKSNKWNFGGLFKKKSSVKDIQSEGEINVEDTVLGTPQGRYRGDSDKNVINNNISLPARNSGNRPPPLPPKNSNVFQPTMQVKGRQHDQPHIFPHLRADLQYPDPGCRIENSGYYYDPRFGYVRTGSYYDQQIALMTGVGPDGLSRVSRESTISRERSSGVHSMPSGMNRMSSNSSLDTTRSWRDQKHVVQRNVEEQRSRLKDTSSDDESSVSSRAHSLSRMPMQDIGLDSSGLSGSVGSLARRSRAARTERYLHRRSKDEEVIPKEMEENKQEVESRIPTHSPYIHTAHTRESWSQVDLGRGHHLPAHRSQSLDTHKHQAPPYRPPFPNHVLHPPAPPPRDPKKKHYLISQPGRPVSYSFENINVSPGVVNPRASFHHYTPTQNHCHNSLTQLSGSAAGQSRVINQQSINNIPLPPRRPLGSHLSASDQQLGRSRSSSGPIMPRPPSQYTPVPNQPPQRGDTFNQISENSLNSITAQSQPSSLQNYIDPEPRSRKPIQFHALGSVASSEGIGSQASSDDHNCDLDLMLQESATEFWKPHQSRLQDVTAISEKQDASELSCDDGVSVNIEDQTDSDVSRIKSLHRDSAIVSNSLPLHDIHSSNLIETSGKCSPCSISSKDSGCSESSENKVPMNKRISVSRPISERISVSRPLSAVVEKSEYTDVASLARENFKHVVSEFTNSAEDHTAGFSTNKRRSHFEEALNELEVICNNIANDEDLLDRAERRDLPTVHQELIWRGRESDNATEDTSHNTSGEIAFSDLDNIMNWNTSSSFENIAGFVTPSRARTPSSRRSGVTDKKLDDMAFRKIMAANKVPTTNANMMGLGNQSYLLLSPVLSPAASCLNVHDYQFGQDDEPDTRTDDVLFRNIRDANLTKVIDPQPMFGIPLGPVSGGANSDYLHAVPEGKYRSTFHPMRNHDIVKDDLAFRILRKDENLSDPDHLGIVKDPNGLIMPRRLWPPNQVNRSSPVVFYPNKHNQVMRSLSDNIAQIIKKQSSKPSAELNDIITYQDLQDPLVYDCMKYTMDVIKKEKSKSSSGKFKKNAKIIKRPSRRGSGHPEWAGKTVYDLLRSSGNLSEPENMHSEVHFIHHDAPTKDDLLNRCTEETECDSSRTETSDEGVESVSTTSDLSNLVRDNLPQVVTDNLPRCKDDLASGDLPHVVTVQSCSTPTPQMANSTSLMSLDSPNLTSKLMANEQEQCVENEPKLAESVSENVRSNERTHPETEQANQTEAEEMSAENHQEIIVQSCLIEQNNIDLKMDKRYFSKPSYMASIVEESRVKDSKTLSDGGEFEFVESDPDKETEIGRVQTEFQEVADTIDLSIKENHETPMKEESETVIESERAKSERSTECKSESNVETRPPSGDTRIKRPESGISRTVNMIGHLGGLEEGKLSDLTDEDLSLPGV